MVAFLHEKQQQQQNGTLIFLMDSYKSIKDLGFLLLGKKDDKYKIPSPFFSEKKKNGWVHRFSPSNFIGGFLGSLS